MHCHCVAGQLNYISSSVIITPLSVRISSHRAWMGKKKEEKEEPGGFERKDEGALADHLKQCQKLASGKDFNKGYLFTILV